MRHIGATVSIDPEQAPALFNFLANSEDIAEARILDVNTAFEGVETILLAVDGDVQAVETRLPELPGIDSVEVSEGGADRVYALVVMRPPETKTFDAIYRFGPHAGFVIRMPIIYRDGNMYAHAVGDPEPLQRAYDSAPEGMDVQIDEISGFHGGADDPTAALSDRQLEALLVALRIGYYDQPRSGTHDDVAEELGCAPQTASDHLQKAEAKLIRTIMDDFDWED